ncbi:MAG TPA: cadmium-translocating P-type ATPase [Gammaproteobacteria bacterium]|nr:cadmium-translocating P-type ATPase [Gammaproteobacteria bacterium]
MSDSNTQECFHCGLPVLEDLDLKVEILGKKREMCCMGCQAVAQAIVENHLEDYYQHRTEKAASGEALVPEALRELQLYDNDNLQQSFVHVREGDIREAALILEGIVCAACVWLSERHVSALEGVLGFHVNYSTHRAQVTWDNSKTKLSTILQSISEIGYHAHPFDPSRQEALQKKERNQALRRIGIAGVGAMQVMMMAVAMYLGDYQGMDDGIRKLLRWASLIVTIPVVFYSGQAFFQSAWRDLRQGRLGMDVPVSLAIGTAFIASAWATWTNTGHVYFDSVTMFTFFLLIGRSLEMSARHKAGQVAEELVKLMPATAHKVTPEGIVAVPVAEVQIGDHLVIKPGEVVPADGVVDEGASSVNEALLTGESLPRRKQPGDRVIGGTINTESPLTIEVDKVGQDTVLAGISRLLERAHAEKPRVAELANRVAGWFVAGLLIVAALVFAYWYFRAPEDALWITLSVLVITCPCALSLATPVALTAATGALTKRGVLTTRGHALETLAKTTDIVFDKTGTLTHGKLTLVDVTVLGKYDEAWLRDMAAGLESYSEHPIAEALKSGVEPLKVEVIESETGRGVMGKYKGDYYRLGSLNYVREWCPGFEAAEVAGTWIYLAGRKGVLGGFHLNDEPRAEAADVVAQLDRLGITVHLLSGDNKEAVASVAKAMGIKHFLAAQLPDSKLDYVRQMQARGKVVAMIGDGVNDAPVLAAAQVSIAMGTGAQLAQASADMVLLSDNLDVLPYSVEMARKTLSIIRQNIVWAIGYNLIALPLAAAGYILPWMAAIGMSGSSLFVVMNALRLKDKR